MSSHDSGESASQPKSRMWKAHLLAIATAFCFYITAAHATDQRQFFGLWKTRYFIGGCFLAWLTIASYLAGVGRRAQFRFVAITMMAGFMCVLLEILGTMSLVAYPSLFRNVGGDSRGTRAIPHQKISGTTHQDVAIMWGLDSKPIDFDFQTDRFGFRNAVDRAEADIYFVGDSILVAGLLPIGDTLSSRLEKEWQRPVMNVALVGIGPQEERDLLFDAQVPLRDRLVLQFLFEDNDLLDSARYRRTSSKKSPPSLKEKSFAYNLMLWLQRLTNPVHPIAARRHGRIGGDDYYFLWTSGLDNPPDAEIKEVEPVLDAVREMKRRITESGGAYGVVLVPGKLRVLGPLCKWPENSDLRDFAKHLTPLRDHLKALCESEGLPFLDLTEVLAGMAATGTIPWYPADTHLNESGHRAAAAALADWPFIKEWNQSHAPTSAQKGLTESSSGS